MKINLVNFFNKKYKNKSNLSMLREKVEILNLEEGKNKNIKFYFFLSEQIPKEVEIDIDELEKRLLEILKNIYRKLESGGIFIKIYSKSISKKITEVNITIDYVSYSNTGNLNINIENNEKYNLSSTCSNRKGKITFTINTEILKKNYYLYESNDNITSIILVSNDELFNTFFLSFLEEFKFHYYIFETFDEYKEFENEIFEAKKVIILNKISSSSSEDEILIQSDGENKIRFCVKDITIKNIAKLLNVKMISKHIENDQCLTAKLNVDLKYYEIFFSTINENIEDLEVLNRIKDFESIKKLAHKLKSGAKILKENDLIELLQTIENRAILKKNIQLYIIKLKRIVKRIVKNKLLNN